MTTPAPPVPPPSDNWAGAPTARLLPYSSISYGRPGLVTALGVTSIVLASLGILGTLWSGLMYVPWMMMSSMQFTPPAATTTAVTTPAGSLTAEETDVIVSALESRQPLSEADRAVLVQALPLAELPIAPPADGEWTNPHVLSQLSYVSSWNDGTTSSVDFSFTGGGSINLSASAVTVNVFNANGGWSSTTVNNGVITGTSTNNMNTVTTGFSGPSQAVMALSLAATVLSLGLAVLLMVAGIQTVRGLPSGRILHLWWAWPKIAVALAAAFVNYQFWSSSFFGGGPRSITWAMVGGSLAFGIAWPVAVLLILRSPSLRAYYGPEGAAQPPAFPVEATTM